MLGLLFVLANGKASWRVIPETMQKSTKEIYCKPRSFDSVHFDKVGHRSAMHKNKG